MSNQPATAASNDNRSKFYTVSGTVTHVAEKTLADGRLLGHGYINTTRNGKYVSTLYIIRGKTLETLRKKIVKGEKISVYGEYVTLPGQNGGKARQAIRIVGLTGYKASSLEPARNRQAPQRAAA